MAIDKGLYAAPLGLDEAAMDEPDMEITIEDPESVEIDVDGLQIEIGKEKPSDEDFDANLAEYMDEN